MSEGTAPPRRDEDRPSSDRPPGGDRRPGGRGRDDDRRTSWSVKARLRARARKKARKGQKKVNTTLFVGGHGTVFQYTFALQAATVIVMQKTIMA